MADIEALARNMGFNDNYLNKLKASNQYITESANKDRDMINSQLNQTLSDYERERQKQNGEFIKEGQSAYVDYAKSINPYSTQNSSANRIGLGNSGYAESSLIGANNTYQNRYTNTKTNYDNIFADINNNIAKARETGNIELAKIAKAEQDRMLENLYRINDEYTAEKQREEEKRRWEAEMALQRQAAARSSSSKRRSSGSGGSVVFSDNGGSGQGSSPKNSYADYFMQALEQSGAKYSTGVFNQKLAQLVNNGQITNDEANAIRAMSKEKGIYSGN